MGEMQDFFSSEDLKKQIDHQTKQITLNIKLVLESQKKEKKLFEKNVNLLKKLQQSFKIQQLAEKNKPSFSFNTFDDVNEQLVYISKIIENLKNYGNIFFSYYKQT